MRLTNLVRNWLHKQRKEEQLDQELRCWISPRRKERSAKDI